MPVPLVRRPLQDLDLADGAAVLQWITARVRDEVARTGTVRPRAVLLGEGFSETFDLSALADEQPQANAAATWRALAGRPGVERALAVLGADIEDEQGRRHAAVVFEEIRAGAQLHWSTALLGFHTDAASGVGVPDAAWRTHLTTEVPELLPFLREWAWPPRDAVAAAPGPVVEAPPELWGAFGHLPPDQPLPAHPNDMAGLIHALVSGDLLSGRVAGTAVVRLAGHAWEIWVLGDDMPAPLEEMIRYFANRRSPPAEGVGFAQLTVRDHDGSPTPILQIVAESHGHQVVVRAPLEFPDGPRGKATLGAFGPVLMREVNADHGWLGVPPSVELALDLPEDPSTSG